jgi:hypothetical protein
MWVFNKPGAPKIITPPATDIGRELGERAVILGRTMR